MKKKSIHSKLNLKKHKISHLQQHNLTGGTDSVASATYIIITTIKVLTKYVTNRICPTDSVCPATVTLSEDTECP